MDFEPRDPQTGVPSFTPRAVRGDATAPPNASGGAEDLPAASTPTQSVGTAKPVDETIDTGILPDLSQYDLTVSEALDVFSREGRKRPADRTLQRYCQDGRFDCFKLKTTRNGNPVHEWIINGASLLEFVLSKPIDKTPPPMAAPDLNGVANLIWRRRGGWVFLVSSRQNEVICGVAKNGWRRHR